MSRHRMVRNLTEDDYDDYYDDDYYEEEDYEDYDSSYVAPKHKTSTKNSSSSNSKATNITNNTPKQPTQTISAKDVFANNKNKKKTNTTTTAVSSTLAAGIAKPPPGWGKPSPSSSNATTLQAAAPLPSAGVVKPPPGWGKPSTTTTTVEGSSSSTIVQASTLLATTQQPTTTNTKMSSAPAATTAPSKASSSSQPPPPPPPPPPPSSRQQQPFQKKLPVCLQSSSNLSSQLSMVVLGHVDAGKSTLMGQLLIQTGKISPRQAMRGSGGAQQQLAWLLDENESERARGVTMEIGTKAIQTKQHQIVVLDAPGHADFIPIMITGAANADTCILVVDAVQGEFEAGFSGGGQTKEHILLAKGLGVSQVILAINKLDVEGWDNQSRYQEISQQVQDYLIQQKFKPARIQCVPVSGLTGENVQAQTEPLLRQWYTGPTLMQAMDKFKRATRQLDKPLRFIITDMFAEGKGVVARGRVAQGFVQVGDKVHVLPLGDAATIARLEHLQPPKDEAERLKVAIAGDTVELVLANIDPLRVTVGNVVVDPSHQPMISKKAKAKILIMDQLNIPIIRGAQVLFHMHSLDIPAVVTKLISTLKADGSIHKERPRALTAGKSAVIELKLNTRIVMESFQDCRALGRFVLRRGGDTIAVGVIDEIVLVQS